MDKELKAKWVAALRSGSYQQTVGRMGLHADDKSFYCCLGVLACLTGTSSDRLTPSAGQLEDWGLQDDERLMLERMNDGNDSMRRHSFAEIADYIETSIP